MHGIRLIVRAWKQPNGKLGEEKVEPVVPIDDSAQRPGKWPRVSVVIPALNEARNLPYVAARMPSDIDEIIVVDGHSVDDTAAAARELWPRGIHITQTRTGKGNALACGFAVASGDIIAMIDADGSTDPREIPRFVAVLTAGADFAKGTRFTPGAGSADITRFRKVGNWGLNTLVNALFATQYTDLCYGYNAFWRRCLEIIKLPDIGARAPQWGDGFEVETLINLRIAKNKLRIVEVRSFEANRIFGSSNLNAVRDGARVLRTIKAEYARPPQYSVAYAGHATTARPTALQVRPASPPGQVP